MTTSSPRIQIKGITKQFPGRTITTALQDIHLTAHEAEFVCVVGPSGCGKSTLFNLVAGLDKPTSGTITTTGKVGFMFQESALFPWLSVLDNVAFGLRVRGIAKAEREAQALEMLKEVRLENFAHNFPHELSGGMRQRAALARTLIMHPDIILMDEPFSALDAQTREALHEFLQKLWQATRKTIMFVTHDIREATFLADRIVVLSARPGKVLKIIHNAVPRPRAYFDPALDAIAKQIKDLLHTV